MTASVVLHLPQDAEHEVGRQQVREGACGAHHALSVCRKSFGQPARVRTEQRVAFEEVGRVDDKQHRSGGTQCMRGERQAARARRTP